MQRNKTKSVPSSTGYSSLSRVETVYWKFKEDGGEMFHVNSIEYGDIETIWHVTVEM